MCLSVRMGRYASLKRLACDFGWVRISDGSQGPEKEGEGGFRGTCEVLTPLDVVGEPGKQRGVVGCPCRGFCGQVQREVQKGNDNRCAVCPSANNALLRFRRSMERRREVRKGAASIFSPHVDLAAGGHLKASAGLLQGTQPSP